MNNLETIEEFALREYPIQLIDNPSCNGYNEPDFININENDRLRFIEGAKSQAKRMYSEEDLRETFRQGQNNIDYSDSYGLDSKLT